MDFFERFVRPIQHKTGLHNEKVLPDIAPQDIEQFFRLYRDCFQHHVVSHLSTHGEKLVAAIDQSRKRFLQNDQITAYFVTKVYQPIGLVRTLSDSMDDVIRHYVDSYEEQFLGHLMGDPKVSEPISKHTPGTNRLTFLVGDVGVGKSLLATRVCHDIRKMKKDAERVRLVAVYIDLERNLEKNQDEFTDIDDKFYMAVFRLIRAELLREDDLAAVANNHNQHDSNPIQAIKNLAIDLLSLPVPARLILTFDNVDRFHFYYSKYAFFDNYRKVQWSRVAKNVESLLTRLIDPTYLGDLRFCILFVCRPAVLNVIKLQNVLDNRNGHFREFAIFRQFSSFDSTNSRLGKYVEKNFPLLRPLAAMRSRFRLMRAGIDCVATEPAKHQLYSAMLDKIEQTFERAEDSNEARKGPISAIAELAHHGPRSFIDFLGSLHINPKESGGESSSLINRLFDGNAHDLLRLYVTNSRKRYSQDVGNVPNVFCCDALIHVDDKFRSSAHRPHHHTYWLKYLLLVYLSQREENSDEGWVTLSELVRNLCGERQYEEHLVRFALGALASANDAACIVVDEDSQDSIVRLKLTRRGRQLVAPAHTSDGVPFCFDFDYLQFVIDDLYFALPKPFWTKIYVDADLGYMYRPDASHGLSSREYLSKKIPAVSTFIRVLEASADAERKFRHKGKQGVIDLFPSFEKIYAGYVAALTSILTVPSWGKAMLEVSTSHIETLRNDNSFDDLFSFYNLTFQPPVQEA